MKFKAIWRNLYEINSLFVGTPIRSDVGVSAGMETMYYCEVSDADRVNQGGSIEDEIIDIVELTIDECRNILKQNVNNNLPPSCLLGLSWFLGHTFPHLTTI